MRYLLFLLFSLPLLASCTLENDGNREFDGFWHVERIDTLSTGGQLDVSHQKLFWSIQGKLVTVSDKSSVSTYYFHHHEAADTIHLTDPHIHHRAQGDPELTDVEVLRPFGINSLEESFQYTTSSSRLVLTSSRLRISMKRF